MQCSDEPYINLIVESSSSLEEVQKARITMEFVNGFTIPASTRLEKNKDCFHCGKAVPHSICKGKK